MIRQTTVNDFGIAFRGFRLTLDAMKWTRGMVVAIVVSFFVPGASAAEPGNGSGAVVAWGGNNYGQTTVPAYATNIVEIAGGARHTLVLRADGTVVGWGDNHDGQTTVPLNATNVLAIAAGGYHGLALRRDGTVVAWGYNDWGQAKVPLDATNIVAIAGGYGHSLVLRANGAVVAWGYNAYGQTNVPPDATNVVAVAAGGSFSLALRGDGKVIAWGQYYTQSGYVPMTVPLGLTNVLAIAGGGNHSLALAPDYTVFAWGYNDRGQTNAPPNATNVVAIAGGSGHSLALRSYNTVVAWGEYYNGLEYVPMVAPTELTNVVEVSAGWSHSLALIASGPLIWPRPPPTISLAHGESIALTFSVKQTGSFNSQWSFNGFPIGGATDTNLVISDFGLTNAGAYSVVVSNQFGYGTAVAVVRLPNSPVVLVNGNDVGGGKVDRVDSAQIAMTNTGSGAAIYFTLDGSTPDFTDIPYTGPFTITNSATTRAIAYNFAFTDSAEAAPITVQVWPTYPLSATTPGGGSIGLSPAPYSAGNRYVSNTVVTLTATPASNWSFLGWTGDSSATSNVTSVLMDRARTVAGGFGTPLNLFTNGSGQVQLNPPTGPYAFGSNVKLTALPAPGYYFFGWANAASGFGNPLTFTVTNASGLTANFGALAGNQVSLVVLPSGNGTVSVNPAKNVYTNGETVALTAWPAANQTFTGWSGDASGNLNPLVLALTSSKLITANFAPGSPTNPPVITQPPLSRTLSAGADTVLSFALTGDGPFSYQWRLNSSPISGATNSTLALNGITAAQAGLYNIVVTGPGGAVTSTPASVAIFGMQLIPSGRQPLPLLILDGAIGTQYRLETSPNLSLSNWSLLTPVTLPSSRFYYGDTASSNQPARFYRAVPE